MYFFNINIIAGIKLTHNKEWTYALERLISQEEEHTVTSLIARYFGTLRNFPGSMALCLIVCRKWSFGA